MESLTFNIKMYRNVNSYEAINALLKRDDLVKVQRDELTKLHALQRPLYQEEREYVIRMYTEKSIKRKDIKKPVVEITITCIDDLSIFRNGAI